MKSTRAVLAALFLVLSAAQVTQALPDGFVDEPVAVNLFLPTALGFDPMGRLHVAEKDGFLYRIEGGLTLFPPVLDLSEEVQGTQDKGLLGFAFDPVAMDPAVLYVLYTVDPQPGEPDDQSLVTFARLTRYEVVDGRADLATRTVLLGETWADGIPSCHASHTTGSVVFAPDGSLLLGAGDGAHFDFVDAGQDSTFQDSLCGARFGSVQDVGSLRSQSLETLAGKILRVDPVTGHGLPDNPFYDATNPASPASRTWVLGSRNPFRLDVRPGSYRVGVPGSMQVAAVDVGWLDWEEVNLVRGGENLGWPCFEGLAPLVPFQEDPLTAPRCDLVDADAVTSPVITWRDTNPAPFGFVGQAAVAAEFYDGDTFPLEYHGRLFFADFVDQWLRVAELDDEGQLLGIEEFSFDTGFLVDLEVDPGNGDLLYLTITPGEVRRLRAVDGNRRPSARARVEPVESNPLQVRLVSDGTYDPDGDALSFAWNFGDGPAVSEEANPHHTYAEPGDYLARLLVRDRTGRADSVSLAVTVGRMPPQVVVVDPMDADIFPDGEPITLRATAFHTSPQELSWSWQVDLVHDAHLHPAWFESQQREPVFRFDSHEDRGPDGDRYHYRVTVTVREPGGLEGSDTIRLFPPIQGENHLPVPWVAVTRWSGSAPFLARFDAGPTVDPDADLLEYVWDFGDGTSGTGRTTSHVYRDPGLYRPRLEVRDPAAGVGSTRWAVLAEPPGAVAEWDFDAVTDRGQDPHGHRLDTHAVEATRGVLGDGLLFAGAEGTATPGPVLDDPQAFTVTGWFRRDARRPMVLVGQNDVVEIGFVTSGVLQVSTGSGAALSWWNRVATGRWMHLAAVGDPSGLRLYIDGGVVASTVRTVDGFGHSTAPFRIGGGRVFDLPLPGLEGAADQVRVYDRALSPQEILSLSGVGPASSAPLVSAGDDFEATTGHTIFLSGSVSDDAAPAPPGRVATRWMQVEGPGSVFLFEELSVTSRVRFSTAGRYVLALVADDGELVSEARVTVTVTGPTVGTGGPEGGLGISAFPNPMRSSARFAVATASNEPVRVTLLDVMGRRVRVVHDGVLPGGNGLLRWDRRDQRGIRVAAGLYWVRVASGSETRTIRITVLD